MVSIGAGAEAAGGFALVLGEVYPALPVRSLNHLHIVLPQNGQALLNVGLGLLNGHSRRVAGVNGELQIRVGHGIQAMNLLQQLGVFTHMGGQLLHNQINLPVIHFPGHMLVKKEIVENRVKAPQSGHDFLSLHLALIGCGSDVLILL